MVLLTVCFRPEIAFLGRFGPESQNCQFKLKQLQYAELNAVIHFFFFWNGNTCLSQMRFKNIKMTSLT